MLVDLPWLMKYFQRQEARYNYGPFGISIVGGEGFVKRRVATC